MTGHDAVTLLEEANRCKKLSDSELMFLKNLQHRGAGVVSRKQENWVKMIYERNTKGKYGIIK